MKLISRKAEEEKEDTDFLKEAELKMGKIFSRTGEERAEKNLLGFNNSSGLSLNQYASLR